MGCVFTCKSECANRSTESKPLHELVKSRQECLLPSIRQFFATELKICLSEARICLHYSQGTVHSCAVNLNKQEKREPKRNPNRWFSWMRMGKGKRVDSGSSTRVTAQAGMANEFKQLALLALNDPFRRLDMEEFHTLTENLKQVIEELQNLMVEINESLRSIEQSRNVWNAVLTAVSIVVQVCSLSLVVLGAPTVAVAAVTTIGMVIKTALEVCIGSIWERKKRAIKEDKLVVEKMQAQPLVSLYDHQQSIMSLVRMVKGDYSALAIEMQLLAIPQHDEEALKKRLKEIMEKFNGGQLKAAIISLENMVDECEKMIKVAKEALTSINIP